MKTKLLRAIFILFVFVFITSCAPVDATTVTPLVEIERDYWPTDAWRVTTPQVQGMDAALLDFPAVNLGSDAARRVMNGLPISIPVEEEAQFVRAYDASGALVALMRPGVRTGLWQPHKVFMDRDSSPRSGTSEL